MWPFSRKPDSTPPPRKGAAHDPDGVHGPALRALAPWLAKHRRTGWQPVLVGAPSATRVSQFGGVPRLRRGEVAPTCGACGAPIDLFLQLDGRETPPHSPWTGELVLQLFYCRACDDYAPGSRAHLVRAVPAAELQASAAPRDDALPMRPITGWRAIAETPHPEEHDALGLVCDYDFTTRRTTLTCAEFGIRMAGLDIDATDTEGRALAKAIGTAEGGDKLGGWPCWVQGAEYVPCPRCGTTMRVLFQVDSNGGADHMFGDVGCGHVSQCPQHADTFAFTWACC